jgi:glucose/arabinose dehydrogenase
MGMRNPFRIAIDKKTGWVYWGEPGPDATGESPTRGPAGEDEINRAKAPGFFGWPYFIAGNKPYIMNGVKQDPAHPVNKSPNAKNGETNLPPAQPALLSYSDAGNPTYPAFQSANPRAAIMGGVYNFSPTQASVNRLPPRYNGSLFIMDWARSWINEVTFNSAGEVLAVNPFLKNLSPQGPIDLEFGPDGDMFLLEYNSHALYQIQYTGLCKMNSVSLKKGSKKELSRFPKYELRVLSYPNRLSLPPGSTRVSFYNQAGKKLWEINQLYDRGSDHSVDFPSTIAGKLVWLVFN